jgi:hypothetical protein
MRTWLGWLKRRRSPPTSRFGCVPRLARGRVGERKPRTLPPGALVVLSERGALDQHVVHVAPAPVLPRLEGLDYRVPGGVEVFGSVLIWRCVATAYVPAGETLSQMNPRSAHPQALLAALGGRRYGFSYLIRVFAPLSPQHLHKPPCRHVEHPARRSGLSRATCLERA